MLALIDLNLGNLQSVLGAFELLGARPRVTRRPEEVERAEAVILPGVGAFGDGMASLREQGLLEPLRGHARAGKPLLGICLGMQLLAEQGEEHGLHEGLGLVPGRVVRLQPAEKGWRVPNMGWCDVAVSRPDSVLFRAVPAGESFYFAHSYHLRCADPAAVSATIRYGGSEVT